MKNKMIILILSITLPFFIPFKQTMAFNPSQKGFLFGYITNRETGTPLPDANVTLLNTPYGAASGDGGHYFVKNLPQGKYSIQISVIGFETETRYNIEIKEQTQLNVALNPTVISLNPVIITATGSDHLQKNVSVSSDILTLKDFKGHYGQTAPEIMESTGGMQIRDYGGFAGLKSLSIRGANNAQVLVLLDGIRINSSREGGVDINTIPLEALERIEIIRGGHSALLGTDAIGGAVHLISRESLPSKGFQYGIRSTLGSFGTRGIDAQGAQQIGPLQYHITYHMLESEGDFKYTDPVTGISETRKNNDYDQTNFFIKTHLDLGADTQIKLVYQTMESNRGAAGSLTFPSFVARRSESKKLAHIQLTTQLTSIIRFKLTPFFNISKDHFNDPNDWFPIESKHKNQTQGINLLTQWALLKDFLIYTGGEYRQDKLQSSDLGDINRETFSVFTQGELFYKLPDDLNVKLIPVIRWDQFSDFGDLLTPKLGVVIGTKSINGITLRSNIGRSFRAPTFYDLYYPCDFFGVGNPDLKPEFSTNFDFGLTYDHISDCHLTIDLTYFNNAITDMIQWQPRADFIWTPVNIGKANIQGLENNWTFRFPKNRAYFKMTYTKIKAIDITTDSPSKNNRLIYRPDDKLDFTFGFNYLKFNGSINFRFVEKQYTQEDNKKYLPSYQIINVNAGKQFSIAGITIDANLQLRNLLNKQFMIMDGYPLPGREIRFSLGVAYY